MDMSKNKPSPSGARLSGDDYQHLFTWLNALKLLLKEDSVIRVSFEVKAGNVDDLVVHRSNAPSIYNQIKFVMTQAEPLTYKWFTTPSRSGSSHSPAALLRQHEDSYNRRHASRDGPANKPVASCREIHY